MGEDTRLHLGPIGLSFDDGKMHLLSRGSLDTLGFACLLCEESIVPEFLAQCLIFTTLYQRHRATGSLHDYVEQLWTREIPARCSGDVECEVMPVSTERGQSAKY